MDVFRTPDERFEGLPGYDFEPNYAEVDGLRLHYVDEGERRARSSASTASRPGPTSTGRCSRRCARPATGVICPDYAGFGRSDKPTDRGWYSYDRHVELMSKLLEGLDLTDAVVVVQDWGGPIGLRWAVENADRVGALVILNTGLFTGRVSKGFLAWRDFAEKNPDLPVGFVIQGGTTTELPDEVVAGYEAPFPDAGVEGGRGRSSRCWSRPPRTTRPPSTEREVVADGLSRWEKPALRRVLGQRPGLPVPEGGRAVHRPDPQRRRAGEDRGRRPLPAGGPRRADRRGDARASSPPRDGRRSEPRSDGREAPASKRSRSRSGS